MPTKSPLQAGFLYVDAMVLAPGKASTLKSYWNTLAHGLG